ncbi:flavodoxin family protein [Thalassobellus citreus]|uniref:flavodoxin family protein n=1 Tax=Thalassobellus citreus TaxID=3367752 RepID=UPI0037B5C73A
MKKTVIIQGSSRSYGNTHKIVSYFVTNNNIDIIDLSTKNIGHYDYEYKNENDDFIDLMTHIIESYDTIIFATPVYWYSMSGVLKVFFDRISDLLTVHKNIGRKLRGKNMAMISCSNSNDLIEGFSIPFIESANYLGMNYLGDIHTYIENNEINDTLKLRIDKFIEILKNVK